MKLALALLALALAASAQEHSTHPPDPTRRCYCSIGIHTFRDNAVLFQWYPLFDAECENSADQLCIEQSNEHRDVLEAAGGWAVTIPEHHHPGNVTVGDYACQNLGRDESTGIHPPLYHSICERPTQFTGKGLAEGLCCDKGVHIQCPF